MRRENGKYLWWAAGDTIDIQLTERFHMQWSSRGEYPVVGAREFTHIKKGQRPVPCVGKAVCPLCQQNEQASQQFKAIVFAFDGAPGATAQYLGDEFVTAFTSTAAQKVAEAQRMVISMSGGAFSDDEILAVKYRVTRRPGEKATTWEVTPLGMPQKGVVGKKPTMEVYAPGQNPNSQAAGAAPVMPLAQPVAPVAAPTPVVVPVASAPSGAQIAFAEDDLKIIRQTNDAIQARLDPQSPLYDPSFEPKAVASIRKTLEANKLSQAKVEAVMAVVGEKAVIAVDKLASCGA